MGVYLSLLSQSFPPKSKFSTSDIPDLTGKVMIVTGANTGIGKETVKALLQHNAKVYIAVRDQAKGESAIQELKTSTGKEALFLKFDLGNLGAVKTAAEEFLSKETRLDVLINNAGVMNPPISLLTSDGYDLQFGTNVLVRSNTNRTSLLYQASTAVVDLNSQGIVRWQGSNNTSARKKCSPPYLYFQSKYGNVVLASELDRRYRTEGIVSVSLNPGNIRSDLSRHMGSISRGILNVFLYDISYGALTQLYAGTSPAAADLGGKYLVPWARIGPSREDAHDPKLGQDLWEWCEEQVKDV